MRQNAWCGARSRKIYSMVVAVSAGCRRIRPGPNSNCCQPRRQRNQRPDMEQSDRSAQLRIVVLKWDRLYGDMIRRQIWDVWPNAVVRVYQTGLDALAAIQEAMPDLFIAGAKI